MKNMTYFDLMERRDEALRKERLAMLLDRWGVVEKKLEEIGVKAQLFGSAARGDVNKNSDLDILITDEGEYDAWDLAGVIDEALNGDKHAPCIDFDIVISSKETKERVDRMISESKPVS